MGYAPTSVWYNTDMWKAAGLTDKDIPTTWDQLLEVAKKLTKSDGSQYGLAMADSGWAAYMKGNGTGLYTTDGKVSINSKENKAFLQKMRDFYNGGYAVPGLDDTAARESFESGQSAMVIVGPWEDQAATDKGINHDTFAVPDGDGTYKYADGKTGSNTGSTGLYWWVTSQVGDSEKLPGIYEFFKFYNNHDNQVKWSLGSAYPPNNKTVTADELSDRPLIARDLAVHRQLLHRHRRPQGRLRRHRRLPRHPDPEHRPHRRRHPGSARPGRELHLGLPRRVRRAVSGNPQPNPTHS